MHQRSMTRLLASLASALPLCFSGAALAAEPHGNHGSHDSHAVHWSYEGAGAPENWGKLQKDFSQCRLGKTQSPIDIRTADVAKSQGKAAAGAPLGLAYQSTNLKMLDNGHTIQVNVDGGSVLRIDGQTYELKQFHFHRPSEEKIDGKSFELVAHFVHRSAEGKLAVVAVLFKEGAENPTLQTLWDHIPGQQNLEVAVPGLSFNPVALLPTQRGYYNFQGSLTTPPCSEGVNWFVLTTPVEASRVQIARFGAIYPQNARPVQPQHGRKIRIGGA